MSTLEERAAERRKRMVVNVARSFEEAEEWDTNYWRQLGHEVRFAAAWEMIDQVEAIRGNDVCQPRLQRAAISLQRRGC